MKVWYISRDGSARKHVFQTNRVEPYNLWGGSRRSPSGEVLVVHRWRKDGRWGAYPIPQISPGSTLQNALFQDKDRKTVMAWAQMFAAMTKGEE